MDGYMSHGNLMLKKIIPVLFGVFFMFALFGCGTVKYTPEPEDREYGFHTDDTDGSSSGEIIAEVTEEDLEEEADMILCINGKEVPVTWEDNGSVEALKSLAPLEIQMSMYGGFEQVGPIGTKITASDVNTTTDFGDIVLYSGNQIVIFYGSNSWAYTRLGHVDLSKEEMTELLSNGDVVITLN